MSHILQVPARAASAGVNDLSEASILRDPDIPVVGNANGDVTIVEYFDYQCPPCKKITPELARIVREDGHIRLVFKDWPTLGDASVYAARLALAAKYQNKFAEAHEALISMKQRLTEQSAQTAMVEAGIDVERAKRDLAVHRETIDEILARNKWQALGFDFQGPPSFIVGHLRVTGAVDTARVKQAIADARTDEKKQ
jgi:protein-disulfide isomerase